MNYYIFIRAQNKENALILDVDDNVLPGKNTRSLIQNFQEEHRHLMSKIPGINDMRDKFK